MTPRAPNHRSKPNLSVSATPSMVRPSHTSDRATSVHRDHVHVHVRGDRGRAREHGHVRDRARAHVHALSMTPMTVTMAMPVAVPGNGRRRHYDHRRSDGEYQSSNEP